METLVIEEVRAANLLKMSAHKGLNPFSNLFGKASTAVLERFTPEELVSLDVKELAGVHSRKREQQAERPR